MLPDKLGESFVIRGFLISSEVNAHQTEFVRQDAEGGV